MQDVGACLIWGVWVGVFSYCHSVLGSTCTGVGRVIAYPHLLSLSLDTTWSRVGIGDILDNGSRPGHCLIWRWTDSWPTLTLKGVGGSQLHVSTLPRVDSSVGVSRPTHTRSWVLIVFTVCLNLVTISGKALYTQFRIRCLHISAFEGISFVNSRLLGNLSLLLHSSYSGNIILISKGNCLSQGWQSINAASIVKNGI